MCNKLFKNRYQVSSCSQIEEQLDTWYRVEAQTKLISILGIELHPKCSPTRYQVSSWAALSHKYSPTRYLVSSWAALRQECSPTRYGVSSWIVFVPYCSPTRYQVSSWATFICKFSPTRYEVSSWATLGMQLDTSYRVDPLKDLNWILGIVFKSLRGSTRYGVSR